MDNLVTKIVLSGRHQNTKQFTGFFSGFMDSNSVTFPLRLTLGERACTVPVRTILLIYNHEMAP